ncbi:hypothetical protein [Marinobacterium stanieri]|uniref:hypothetical protein n=1 Tax=Marinobacterium stanieri TaxID=49186 RepID=UPI000255A5DD|nr:hypothetical protein [Marinobacterium stanieri]
MKPNYANPIADNIAPAVMDLLKNERRGDTLSLCGRELSYQSGGNAIIQIGLDKDRFPDPIQDIREFLEQKHGKQCRLPVRESDLYELVAALVRVALLRPDMHAEFLASTSSRTQTFISRLDVRLRHRDDDTNLIDFNLQFDEHCNATESQILVRHYTQVLRNLCKTELCLLAETAEALDPEQHAELISDIRTLLSLRATMGAI